MKRPNKFRNVRTTVGALNFDSKREAKRWFYLVNLVRAGEIAHLERQVVFILAPKVRIEGEKRARAAMKYTADFTYYRDGQKIVEDSKGHADTAFRIRQHLMKSVHGIDVRLS